MARGDLTDEQSAGTGQTANPAEAGAHGVRCTIPDKADQSRNRRKRGGRPPRFDPEDYKARHAVELMNRSPMPERNGV